jgi:hypothetical protein
MQTPNTKKKIIMSATFSVRWQFSDMAMDDSE